MKNIKLVDLFLAFVAGCYVWVAGIGIQEYTDSYWDLKQWVVYLACFIVFVFVICVLVLVTFVIIFINELSMEDDFRNYSHIQPFKKQAFYFLLIFFSIAGIFLKSFKSSCLNPPL